MLPGGLLEGLNCLGENDHARNSRNSAGNMRRTRSLVQGNRVLLCTLDVACSTDVWVVLVCVCSVGKFPFPTQKRAAAWTCTPNQSVIVSMHRRRVFRTQVLHVESSTYIRNASPYIHVACKTRSRHLCAVEMLPPLYAPGFVEQGLNISTIACWQCLQKNFFSSPSAVYLRAPLPSSREPIEP